MTATAAAATDFLNVVPTAILRKRAGVTDLRTPPTIAELRALLPMLRFWEFAPPPPPPREIFRRERSPLVGPADLARIAGTTINRLDLDDRDPATVAVHTVEDAVVIPAKKGFCLLEGGRISRLSPGLPRFRPKRLAISRSFRTGFFTGDAYTSNNIAHFTLDAMGRAFVASRHAGVPDAQIVFSDSELAYVRYVRQAAFPGSVTLAWNRAYHFETLHLIEDFAHPALKADPGILAFLRSAPPGDAAVEPQRRLYVGRRDARRRPLVNEAELEARLVAVGFEAILGSELDPQAQIDAFRDARIVVAPHGAALTNALFMPRGARLVELLGPFDGGLGFLAIARTLGIDHRYLIGQAVDAESKVWTIDLDAVVAAIG